MTESFLFLSQGNNPKLYAASTCIGAQGIKLVCTPPELPDLNPTELVAFHERLHLESGQT